MTYLYPLPKAFMQNFIVSARKYRPQTFDTVVGQRSITSTLKNAIRNNQLAQAFLFCGPRGVGKTTCARILAKTINCENITQNGEACDHCVSCTSFNENASFNIYELDGASNNSVDDIRNLVDQVRIPPQMGKYKVYIIDEVHMLSRIRLQCISENAGRASRLCQVHPGHNRKAQDHPHHPFPLPDLRFPQDHRG